MYQKYKTRIAFLHKRTTNDDGFPIPEEQGVPFYCDVKTVSVRERNPLANSIRISSNRTVLTTRQLNFEKEDYITFQKVPKNDVNMADFSLIKDIDKIPYQESKHRTVEYFEYKLVIS